jgi:hypothetical protein
MWSHYSKVWSSGHLIIEYDGVSSEKTPVDNDYPRNSVFGVPNGLSKKSWYQNWGVW